MRSQPGSVIPAKGSSPIIVFGMHRSGTSLLTSMLGECGIFFGARRDEYQEARGFQAVNERLLEWFDATWDHPKAVLRMTDSAEDIDAAVTSVAAALDEGFFQEYFSGTSPETGIWGWKDPRNTFTLPVWLKLFPAARLVHVLRNGVDVAKSLWRRETRRPEGRSHPHYSERCQSPAGCFSLWEEYVRAARRIYAGHPCLEVRFENLLADPRRELERLLRGLSVTPPTDAARPLSLIKPGGENRPADEAFDSAFFEQARGSVLLEELYA